MPGTRNKTVCSPSPIPFTSSLSWPPNTRHCLAVITQDMEQTQSLAEALLPPSGYIQEVKVFQLLEQMVSEPCLHLNALFSVPCHIMIQN